MKKILLIIVAFAFFQVSNAQEYSREMEKSAKDGDAIAQYRLGLAYAFGRGVTQSNSKALQWMEMSANQGYGLAVNRLASFYFDLGWLDESIEWYTKAYDKGYNVAAYWLGKCYYLKKDIQNTLKWYEKLASGKYSDAGVIACYNIGEIYSEGKYIKADYDVALQWYKKAALQIHVGAMKEIDKIYYYRLCKEEGELERRFWYEKLAKDGYGSGYNGLGEIYLKEKNYAKAYEMFSKAIEKKNNTAVGNMGEMYYYGYFVKKNHLIAFELLKQAATDKDCPNAKAMRLLSACYRYGLGTEKNEAMEKQWMDMAVKHKDKKAMSILGLQ